MAKKKALAGGAAPSFEEALVRLEAIVRELEEDDLPLERSLAVFEEGVRLSRLLHERLNDAERKVEILLRNEDGAKVPSPFAPAGAAVVAAASAASGGDAGEDDAGEDAADGQAGEGESGAGHGQSTLPF